VIKSSKDNNYHRKVNEVIVKNNKYSKGDNKMFSPHSKGDFYTQKVIVKECRLIYYILCN